MREEFFEWVISHPNINPSCVSSDIVTVLNPESNQKEVILKMSMDIYVRDLQNGMIKPSVNGGLASLTDFVTQEVLISDTTFGSFITQNVCTMTPELRQICGCEICVIQKDVNIDLNTFRTILVTYLQQTYVTRHTHNRLFITTSAAHYKDKVFPDG